MSSPLAVHQAVIARLREIPNVTVFDGDVPTKPPADSNGHVLPYLVVWGTGTDRAGAVLTGAAPDVLVPTVTVTAAGGTVARCLQAGELAHQKLSGWRPLPTSGPFAPIAGTPDVQTDRDVTPARMFQPHLYRCTTT